MSGKKLPLILATLAILLLLNIVPASVRANNYPTVVVNGNISSNTTWSGGTVYSVLGAVSVLSGATLHIEAGAIIKYSPTGALRVSQGGTLNTTGTTTNPVIFTALSDDSAGGNSDGNGGTIPQLGSYNRAVEVTGGTVNIVGAKFRYANAAIYTDCREASTTPAPISITNSSIGSSVEFSFCGQGIVSLQRNTLEQPVQGRPVISAYSSDVSGIVLAGVNKNYAPIPGMGNVIGIAGGYISSGSTMSFSGESNAVISAGTLDVRGTLNMGAGAVVKSTIHSTSALRVSQGGTLNTTGTTTNPVIFTALSDDSAGGNSDGNGGTIPQLGSYNRAVEVTGGTVNIVGAKFRYANAALDITNGDAISVSNIAIQDVGTGLSVSSGSIKMTDANISSSQTGLSVGGSAKVIYRGKFSNITGKAIVACNWGQECNVDATYTDWGTSNGPIMVSGYMVCGAIASIPWRHGGVTQSTTPLITPNCDNSETPTQRLSGNSAYFNQRMSQRTVDCSGGYQDACQAMQNALTCLSGAVNLAGSTSPFPLPQLNDQGQAASWPETYSGALTNYAIDQAVEIVSPSGFSSIFSILKPALGTVDTMANAYNGCAP